MEVFDEHVDGDYFSIYFDKYKDYPEKERKYAEDNVKEWNELFEQVLVHSWYYRIVNTSGYYNYVKLPDGSSIRESIETENQKDIVVITEDEQKNGTVLDVIAATVALIYIQCSLHVMCERSPLVNIGLDIIIYGVISKS